MGLLEDFVEIDKLTDEDLVMAFADCPVDVLKAIIKRQAGLR